VYDELDVSAPTGDKVKQMHILKEVMQQPRLGMTVPVLSSGKWGRSWGELEKCE
jgi:hypothetical protein